MRNAKCKYSAHRSSANKRNIPFNLTFDEWYNWWLAHGEDKNLSQPSRNGNTLCMCRKNDIGPYALSNIYCDTIRNNTKTYHQHTTQYTPTHPGKRIKTPLGIFDSALQAALAHGKNANWIAYRLRKHPVDYYYI
jgi:hypothetical protein